MPLFLLLAMLAGSMPPQPVPADEPGVTGYVLAPDGLPVSSGTVVIQSPGGSTTTPIERSGRFRFVPVRSGVYRLVVAVQGLTPYRMSVNVPQSRALLLPVIRLELPTYYRVRVLTPGGETIPSPQLRTVSFDPGGSRLADVPGGDGISQQTDGEGAAILGPLPPGITALALDMSIYAQMRLPNVVVNGSDPLIDGGTVRAQPPSTLHVDLLDDTGAPVPNWDVSLEDVLPLSPLTFPFPPLRTNAQGRVTFERLAAGRYRVRTGTLGRCPDRVLPVSNRLVPPGLPIAREVTLPIGGTHDERIVISGKATFRISGPLGAIKGMPASATPNIARQPLPAQIRTGGDPAMLMRLLNSTDCRGTTDGDGRVTFSVFPPGPADIGVLFGNSTYVRRLTVPMGGGEVAITIPDGLLPVRVLNAAKNTPVARAFVTWTVEGGGRSEATAGATGDVLLEGTGMKPGVLTVTAPGYRTFEEQLSEPPGILHDVALVPEPSTRMEVRVAVASGEPLANAVVTVMPSSPMDAPQVAVTDTKGSAIFSELPAGTLRVTAVADGFAARAVQVADENRGDLTMALARGYRIAASVELPPAAGRLTVRVLNDAGATLDRLLDAASDRTIDTPARLSLGPLPPGTYAIELRGAVERRERLVIVDRDAVAVIR